MTIQIVICCLIITTIIQSLEIHYMKKNFDMLANDVWHIEENQENEKADNEE